MNIKQKIIMLMIVTLTSFGFVSLSGASVEAAKCGSAETSIITCEASDDSENKDIKQNAIWQVLLLVLNIMTGGVGVLAVAGIAYGGILYASSSDKPEQTKKGISVITNVVIGIIAYAFMFLLLNFLVPGGIFA